MIRQQLHETSSLWPRRPDTGSGRNMNRHLLFLCICTVALILFRSPVETLWRLALHDDRYSTTLAIPLISLGLVWLKGRTTFAEARYCLGIGLVLVLGGISLFAVTELSSHPSVDYVLSINVFAALAVWAGAFVGCYGTRVAKGIIFPLAFLILMIPIPTSVLEHIVNALQRGSAGSAYVLFKLVGVPVFREGPCKFALPGVTIEVAQECSGIRSSLSLFICSIAAGYLFLRSSWARASLALATLPIVIFKNAVRIVTISSLGVYVDPGFLHGQLHRNGGLPFSSGSGPVGAGASSAHENRDTPRK